MNETQTQQINEKQIKNFYKTIYIDILLIELNITNRVKYLHNL